MANSEWDEFDGAAQARLELDLAREEIEGWKAVCGMALEELMRAGGIDVLRLRQILTPRLDEMLAAAEKRTKKAEAAPSKANEGRKARRRHDAMTHAASFVTFDATWSA